MNNGVIWARIANLINPTKFSLLKYTQQLLLDITQDYVLSQMVLEPTCSDDILDLFFTNSSILIEEVQIIAGLSDHNVVAVQSNKMRTSALKQTSCEMML